MAKTTIELDESVKQELRAARLPHENSYNDTVKRLLGENEKTAWTEDEIRGLVRDEVRNIRR